MGWLLKLCICTQSDKAAQSMKLKFLLMKKTYNLARGFHLDPTVCAMNGGEDYELLFTINQKILKKLTVIDISIIGHITAKEDGYYMLDKSDRKVALKTQGWDALKSKNITMSQKTTILCWNVNGIRTIWKKGFPEWLTKKCPMYYVFGNQRHNRNNWMMK